MRFSRTNMRLAAARCRSLSRKIGVQTAEFSITAFCWRNADSRKSRTYERHNAEIRLELFNLSLASSTRGDASTARRNCSANMRDPLGVGPAREGHPVIATGSQAEHHRYRESLSSLTEGRIFGRIK